MPLTAFLRRATEPPHAHQEQEDEEVCSFDADEGPYWFLHPLFERLRDETGEYIDLYGTAAFRGGALDDLARTFAAARSLVAAQPDRWDVVTGLELRPHPGEVRATVEKGRMNLLLDALEEGVRRAKAEDASLIFWGD